MHNIAIIPARGGSKRIPKKNIRDFLGKPVLAYSIETALSSGLFQDVYVSTDDPEIAEIANRYGAKVPFLRSEQNSNDHATLADALNEELSRLAEIGVKPQNICCILPVAPLVTVSILQNAFDRFIDGGQGVLVPFVQYSTPIQRARQVCNGKMVMAYSEYQTTRSQDLPESFYDAGIFYWLDVEKFMENKFILYGPSDYLILKEDHVQDVDVLEDWIKLEKKFRELQATLVKN